MAGSEGLSSSHIFDIHYLKINIHTIYTYTSSSDHVTTHGWILTPHITVTGHRRSVAQWHPVSFTEITVWFAVAWVEVVLGGERKLPELGRCVAQQPRRGLPPPPPVQCYISYL